MPTKKSAVTPSADAPKRATGRNAAHSRAGSKPGSAAARRSGSGIMRARVDEAFARTLVDEDAAVLGLAGPSELVREGLRLVHERASEAAMVAAYDRFYGGGIAPLPSGVAPTEND